MKKLKTHFSQKENLKKYSSFEEQKGIFEEMFLLTLSSLAVFLLQNCASNFFCFAWEIKGFYQISWGNKTDFTNMICFPKYLCPWWKFQKLRHSFVDERAMITTTLVSSCCWKTLVAFDLWKKIHEDSFQNQVWIVIKLYRKTIYAIQNNSKLTYFIDICYLVIGCFY